MYLALRSTAASKGSLKHKISTAVIRAVLCTDYPHAGIVIDGLLYHSNAEFGLNKTEFTPEKWELIDLGPERDQEVLALYEELKGTPYDWLELFDFTFVRNIMKLVRKIPWLGVRLLLWMYCFQWCWRAMTGKPATRRITAETLLLQSLRIVQRRCDKT